jgi:predicted alpha/beta-fold hydrolase
LAPFVPLFRNHHLLTLAGTVWIRSLDTLRFPVTETLFETEPGVKVLVQSQRPGGGSRGEIVLVHGLEGSGESGYMRSMAQTALEAGFAAHRFHMRTCGGTGHLCETLYHGGLTSDLLAWIRHLKERRPETPLYVAGFSLGGNVVLKLAGELGNEAQGLVDGVAAVSTPIDLGACARHMGTRENKLYDLHFVSAMRRHIATTGRYSREALLRPRSIYEFDDQFTAPGFGFRSADHYYSTQSANSFLSRIRVPALLIQAKDDTFIPFPVYSHPGLAANPRIELVITEHGGHLGFIARRPPRFWVDHAVIGWFAARSAC